jgi:malate synthase
LAQVHGGNPFLVQKVRRLVTARKIALPVAIALLVTGCARTGEVTLGGITAIRTACPAVAVPAATGDITLFNPASSQDQSALDVTALMTNVRSTCSDVGDNVQTVVTFDIRARRTNVQGARDVTLPYFITVVQGGTAVVAKRIGRVSIHFDDGQARSSINGQATANVLRSAATLSPEVRKTLTRVRKAGADDAAVDPLARPEIRQAVLRASFEALVGFQLTDEQLKFNATR